MTTTADVRASLAGAVKTGTGLTCLPYLIDHVDAPVAMVGVRPFDPRLVFGKAKVVYPFFVRLFVSSLSAIEEAQRFDEYREVSGSKSVTQAVEDGTLWTCTVDYALVTQIGDPRDETVNGVTYKAVDFDVEVCW